MYKLWYQSKTVILNGLLLVSSVAGAVFTHLSATGQVAYIPQWALVALSVVSALNVVLRFNSPKTVVMTKKAIE